MADPHPGLPDDGERGSAVVDFVMVSLLIVALLLAVLQVAVYVHVRNVVTASAQLGARFAANADVDVEAVAEALVPWFAPVHVAGALAYAIGTLAFASAIAHSGMLTRRVTHLVVAGLAITAIARFVPVTAVHFYVQSAAAIVALWPLAAVIAARGIASTGRRATISTAAQG